MKHTYYEGRYFIKSKGRGVVSAYLTKSQARALFQLLGNRQLELEGIAYDDGSYTDGHHPFDF